MALSYRPAATAIKEVIHVSRVNQIARTTNKAGIYTDGIDSCIGVALLAKGKALSLIHDFGLNSLEFFQNELDYIQKNDGDANNIILHIAYNHPLDPSRIGQYILLFQEKFPAANIKQHRNCSLLTVCLSGEVLLNMHPGFEGYTLLKSPIHDTVNDWCDLHAYACISVPLQIIYDDTWQTRVAPIDARLKKMAHQHPEEISLGICKDFFRASANHKSMQILQAYFKLDTPEQLFEKMAYIFYPYIKNYAQQLYYNHLKTLPLKQLVDACRKCCATAMLVLTSDLRDKLGRYHPKSYFLLTEGINISPHTFHQSTTQAAAGDYLFQIAKAHKEAFEFIQQHEKNSLSPIQMNALMHHHEEKIDPPFFFGF